MNIIYGEGPPLKIPKGNGETIPQSKTVSHSLKRD